MKVPVRLARDPIIEAVLEIRFVAKPAASELLPGLLVSRVNGLGAPTRFPIAQLPRELQETNPNLRYQPRLGLKGNNYAVYLGDHSLIVSCTRPYIGWGRFRQVILEVLNALEATDLVEKVERVAVKYINVIEAPEGREQLELIKLEAKLGAFNLLDHVTLIHTEVTEQDFINVIDVQSHATAQPPGSAPVSGLLVTVDTICSQMEGFWQRKEAVIDELHAKEKETFFALLTSSTIEKLEPEW